MTERFTKLYRRMVIGCLAILFGVALVAGGILVFGGGKFIQAAAWDGTIATEFAGGSGTKAAPYIIRTAEQLARVASVVNSNISPDLHNNTNTYYVLETDIVLNVTGSLSRMWDPIGNSTYQFKGNFEGNNKTINGLYIDRSASDYQGLFGYTSGPVQNVTVQNGSVRGRNYVGGVAGRITAAIDNCANSAVTITGGDSGSGSSYVGGVVGYASAKVSYCSNTGTVTGGTAYSGSTGSQGSYGGNYYPGGTGGTGGAGGESHTGGIVGYSSVNVDSCVNQGIVTGGRGGTGGVGGAGGSGWSPGTWSNYYALPGELAVLEVKVGEVEQVELSVHVLLFITVSIEARLRAEQAEQAEQVAMAEVVDFLTVQVLNVLEMAEKVEAVDPVVHLRLAELQVLQRFTTLITRQLLLAEQAEQAAVGEMEEMVVFGMPQARHRPYRRVPLMRVMVAMVAMVVQVTVPMSGDSQVAVRLW